MAVIWFWVCDAGVHLEEALDQQLLSFSLSVTTIIQVCMASMTEEHGPLAILQVLILTNIATDSLHTYVSGRTPTPPGLYHFLPKVSLFC